MVSAAQLPPISISPRKKVIRLFQGIAGSPLSTTADPASIPIQKPKRGRPRKFANEAEKKRHYRAVKSDKRSERQKLADIEAQLPKMTDGMYMDGAPSGKSLLISGGYDPERARQCERKHLEGLQGRKVRPKGRGDCEDHTNGQDGRKVTDEWEGKFQNDPKFAIRSNWKITDEREQIVRNFVIENMEPTEPGCLDFSRCKLCDFTFNFISAGIRHFLDQHNKLVRAEIRANQPRRTPGKKGEQVPFGILGTAYLKSVKQS